jgi:hypothetical protein
MVADWQPLSCWISSKAHISDLKHQLADMIGICHANEFELFENKDKNLKLIYEKEIISKFKD